ncbi:AAA family ATPase [Leptothoe kymatousa]|uniref:AAA family ATPase n=1 Tax=Leptothoe kymatousa TAU-MAC 1615 TaxID=2364775 RepID=A0ABS5Y5W2_9CYAN|nr:AAA family ATPase [Leptothoe kymatousa]MBT9313208.1 AAA family ATPase [Leptothoe kymatousa TAU-MAC 1615]
MHLQRLKLPAFRNLQDFEITFTESVEDPNLEGGQRTFNSHAVIGANGSGKSNLIEAVITIFRDLDLNQSASFDYEMDYSIRDHNIKLKAVHGKRPTVIIDGKRRSAKQLNNEAREYLPSNVFVYYSGKNSRIERLFQAHQRRFNKQMEVTSEEYLPEQLLLDFAEQEERAEALAEYKRRTDRQREQLGEDQLRRLFYCRSGHSQLVLLACLLSKDELFTELLEDLNIEELDSALFVLKQPYRLRQPKEKDILEGDKRFWYARGTAVNEFLHNLWGLAVAPIEDTVSKQIDFRGRTEKQQQLYLFLPDKERLQQLGDLVGEADRFFRYAEASYIGDLIEEVRINFKLKDSDGNINFSQLSEGELQLLTVLGLMRITKMDDCLFLLDEPDTHLNPIWKLRYFEEIEKVVLSNEQETLAGDSQIIITTHDPLMIGSLRLEQVRILRKEHGQSTVETPVEHPQGMGVSGLLKSDMFGLPSTLDRPTLRKLEERNILLARKAKESLSQIEEEKLNQLSSYLDDLGFSREYRDPLYQLFIQKMYEVRSQPLSKILTDKELQQQNELAQEIVTELVKRERVDNLSELAQELKLRLES